MFLINKNKYICSRVYPELGNRFYKRRSIYFFSYKGKRILCLAPTNLIAYQQKGTTIHKKIESICNFLDIKRFNCDTLFIEKLIRNNYNNIRDMSLTELCRCISELPSQKKNICTVFKFRKSYHFYR